MRIFLTGATGYIGAAVLDALVRAGHDVTALVRTPRRRDALAARGAHPVIGDLADREVVSRGRRRDGRVHPHGRRLDGRSGQRSIARPSRCSWRPHSAARRTPAATAFVYTSGVWVLGSDAQPLTETAQTESRAAAGLAARRTSSSCCRRRRRACRTVVIRPGVVYGGRAASSADLFKNAINGLVRVVGDGNNHWPLVYDRDLADLYVRRRDARATRPASITRTTKATSASTTSSRASSVTARCRPTCATCRSTKRGRRWARTPTRWRSIRWSAARAPARSAGRRRCTRSAGTCRGCSKNSAAARNARRKRRSSNRDQSIDRRSTIDYTTYRLSDVDSTIDACGAIALLPSS